MFPFKRHLYSSALIALSVLAVLPAAGAQNEEDKRPRLVVQTGHTNDVYSVAFSPDGKMLASGSLDNTVKLWDLQTGKELKTLFTDAEPSNTVFSVAFSPDGKTLASAGSRETTIKLWDVGSGKRLRTLAGHEHFVMSVAFSPDGETLGSGSWDNTVRLWDVQTGQDVGVLRGHTSYVYSVAFSPDGKMLASGGWNDTVKLWNAQTGRELRTLSGHTRGVGSVAFSPDGKALAAGTRDKAIKFWDVASGGELRPLVGHMYSVTSIAFSPNGKMLASAESGRSIKLWDLTSGQELKNLTQETSAMHTVTFSPDGGTLASGNGKIIKLWDVQTGRQSNTLSGHTSPAWSTAFSPDGKMIAVGSSDNAVRLWDVQTGKRLKRLTGHKGEIWSITFSPDGKMLASLAGSLNMTVRLWDVRTGRELKTFPGDTAFAFSPDGKIFATGTRDKTIKLWDAASGQELNTLTGATSEIRTIVFSHDGGTVATGGFKTVRLWDVKTGQPLEPLVGHTANIWSIAFSPDRKTVATASEDQSVILWNLPMRQPLRTLSGHAAAVWAVAFSPDGKVVASRSGNYYILLSEVASGLEMKSFGRDDLNVVRQVHEVVPAFYHHSRYEPVSPDGRFQIKISDNSKLNLYELRNGNLLVSLIALDDSDWAVVTPDGRFDTNKNLSRNIKGLHWIFPDLPSTPLSFNIFMRDYYEPRLLSRLLKGEKLSLPPSLAELNRLQPRVGKIAILPRADNPDLVDVKVKVESVTGQCTRGGKQRPCESGIYDLRLYRDGQLVDQAPRSEPKLFNSSLGTQSRQEQLREWRELSSVITAGRHRSVKSAAGNHEVTFNNIRLPKRASLTQVEFTAYAFNEDRVKSETSEPVPYTLPGHSQTTASRRAYLITVGVDATSARNWRLLFAPNGARDIETLLKEKMQAGYEIVPVQLISEFKEDGLSFKQNLATKINIKTVFDILSGREVAADRREQIPAQEKLRAATPDDLVMVYIASHGYADPKGMFYILPSDLGEAAATVSEALLNRCLTTAEQSESCRAARSFLEHSISSEELTEWVQTVDAGEMTLILDSCHSAAVAGSNFKPGPMGDRGFGQLSYDKGMRVLAATQVENVALGTLALSDRSLLTHALMRGKDAQPFVIELWLEEAEKFVPELYKKQLTVADGPPQEPVFFNFVEN